MKKIRIGIELNHVIRNINKQIVKYYQQDYDESIDLDEVDYKDDVLKTICHFSSDMKKIEFLYELYPLAASFVSFLCGNLFGNVSFTDVLGSPHPVTLIA